MKRYYPDILTFFVGIALLISTTAEARKDKYKHYWEGHRITISQSEYNTTR